MPTITAGDFRNGVTFEMDGQVMTVVEFQHVKPGKGAAFVRTKIKNVVTGSVIERTFNPTEKFPKAYIETKEMQYTYNDGDFYHFMDLETYDDLPLTHDQVEDAMPFVKENTNVTVRFFKGVPFGPMPALCAMDMNTTGIETFNFVLIKWMICCICSMRMSTSALWSSVPQNS